MVYVRQKEDPWNSIIAAAATGGFLQMRKGPGPAARSAFFGGVILALVEGAGIMLNRFLSVPPILPVLEDPALGLSPNLAVAMGGARAAEEAAGSSSSSWFGGFFGLGKKEERKNGGAVSEVLDSFDSGSTPIPTFEYK
ncbi:Mitochondrial import inner membrane translocase subunit TIM17-2 [Dendrobium catenatum]|uniref:Mitochondrial import inner membrane translocase subunit TIM17-2 n=1 Tax=Dendrobium catenatum TaxID=906689 RepID=A0A2I0VCX1_9ASPA|nr:Mitochondrial import inner membrane translocase subunit TIM17-2 [Dendrobium catenatum]